MSEQTGDWLQTVRRLVNILARSDVDQFELTQTDFRLRLKRSTQFRPANGQVEPEPNAVEGQPIVAPFTGIFYRAASPTSEPYVHEGDWVEPGATIGLIETMKIFNEVSTEQAGRIERILAVSGQLVHAGDTVALLMPGDRLTDEQLPA